MKFFLKIGGHAGNRHEAYCSFFMIIIIIFAQHQSILMGKLLQDLLCPMHIESFENKFIII